MAVTWAERIAAARERGKTEGLVRFTEEDLVAAAEWQSCAVGETFPELMDECQVFLRLGPLEYLGVEFCKAVENNDVDEAERLLEMIQREKLFHPEGF